MEVRDKDREKEKIRQERAMDVLVEDLENERKRVEELIIEKEKERAIWKEKEDRREDERLKYRLLEEELKQSKINKVIS
ncbi:MAG: hypothetical protein EZS28_026797 [Streblomastix strix]|uniref:Uncharacterized protein n=1 Tax=Streblomastix strix TaxID=222440 RepID=A0A5J4V5M6_9EUKA|nr:MAG: hypothetical protein EZS28_026797 [Streblomastix strix]